MTPQRSGAKRQKKKKKIQGSSSAPQKGEPERKPLQFTDLLSKSHTGLTNSRPAASHPERGEHSGLRAQYRRPGVSTFDLRRPGADVLLRGGILHRDEYQQGRDQMNQDAEGAGGPSPALASSEVCREKTRIFLTEVPVRVAKAVTRL